MTERLIELRGIGKRYGVGEAAFNALTNVDLTIDQGEFVAIMGPSGSGKSTMMNIIGALDSPSSGQYLFKGLHVETLTRDERALLRRRFMGFVFQGFKKHTPAELSGGQQQRVAIARAIVTKPLLLLADEPTGSLDSHRSVEIMELLTDLNKSENITVVLVTHEPDMAVYARRCVRCVDGSIASDTPQEGR